MSDRTKLAELLADFSFVCLSVFADCFRPMRLARAKVCVCVCEIFDDKRLRQEQYNNITTGTATKNEEKKAEQENYTPPAAAVVVHYYQFNAVQSAK